jgi:hypothetical protein
VIDATRGTVIGACGESEATAGQPNSDLQIVGCVIKSPASDSGNGATGVAHQGLLFAEGIFGGAVMNTVNIARQVATRDYDIHSLEPKASDENPAYALGTGIGIAGSFIGSAFALGSRVLPGSQAEELAAAGTFTVLIANVASTIIQLEEERAK